MTTLKIVKVFKNSNDAQADAMKERTAYMSRMEKASQEQIKKDDKVIQDYLAANHIQADKTTKGTYIQILTAGQGPKPETGKTVMLRYKGSNLNGEVFDSNEAPNAPLLPFQVGSGGTIPGFEDGVKELPKGTKARIFIPSALAYGPQGRQPKIKPNENLIFDLEVVNIVDAPPAPRQMPSNMDTSGRH